MGYSNGVDERGIYKGGGVGASCVGRVGTKARSAAARGERRAFSVVCDVAVHLKFTKIERKRLRSRHEQEYGSIRRRRGAVGVFPIVRREEGEEAVLPLVVLF